MEKVYNKLVRDNIPQIIRDKGEIPVTRILNDEEYKKALEEKLFEEYKEVIEASGKDRLEEIVDLIEVAKSLAELENSSLEQVMEIGKEKRIKRGGFQQKIYLEKALEKE